MIHQSIFHHHAPHKKYAQKINKIKKKNRSMTTTKNETTTTPQIRREVGHIRSVLASTMLRSMLSQIDRAKQGSLAGAGSFVVSLGHDDTCETALNTLKRYNVLSAPVLVQNVELNREDERATCLGFLSVSDVIDPLVEAFEDEKKLEKMEDPINMLQAMSLLRKVAPEVFSKKIIQIGNLSDVDLVFEPYAKELSILEAMENFLAKKHHLVHRLGVFDPHGEIHVRAILQSDIIKFLQMKNEQGVFKELSRLTVQDCGFAPRKERSVSVASSRTNLRSTFLKNCVIEISRVSASCTKMC